MSRANKMHSRKRRKHAADIAAFIAIVLLALLSIFPVWWIFRSSLMTNAQLMTNPPRLFPDKWLFSNYAETLQSFLFFRYFKNTMTIIVPSVLAGTVTATMCGYAFARLRFRGRDFIFSLCIGSMLLPGMVTLVPLYIAWTKGLHLADSYWPLIIPFFCGGGACNIFLIRQFIRTIPRELDEAAMIDGAGYVRTLVKIIVPAIKPAMVVVALMLFIFLWNDVINQMVYINSMEKYTIAIGLNIFRGAYGTNWKNTMCATCLSFLPGIIFYLIGQKSFVEGIVMTGMKN